MQAEKDRMQGLNVILEKLTFRGSGSIDEPAIRNLIEILKTHESEVKLELTNAYKDAEQYKKEAERCGQLHERINQLETDLANTRADLEAARAEITRLRRLLQIKTEENGSLKIELAGVKEREEQLQRLLNIKIKDWKEEKKKLMQSLEKYEQEKTNPEALLEQIRANYKKELDRRKQEYFEKEESLRLAYEEKLRNERKSLKREIDRYQELLDIHGVRQNKQTRLGGDDERDGDMTPSTSGYKRRRTGRGEQSGEQSQQIDTRRRLQYERTSNITNTSSSTGLVTIEVDPDGQFIKLHNKTNRDQSLSEWELKHLINEDQETIFTFPSNYKLKKTVTIWSSNAGGRPRSPRARARTQTHLVLDADLNWGSGNDFETTLVNHVNGSEQVMACLKRRIEREVIADDNYDGQDRQSSSDEEDPEEYSLNLTSDYEEDDEEYQRCKVM